MSLDSNNFAGTVAPASTPPLAGAPEKKRGSLKLREFGLLGAVVLLILVFAVLAPNFVTTFNALNVLRQVSIVAVAAVGMTMIILIAGIDLSVGSVIALCGTTTAI